MKVYSIGRDVNCNIVIDDNTDVISRRHATLNVSSTGKMTIVDQSQNGTYVNGIRIQPNVPVPVTRKDNVSFAHVIRLDWGLVPNSYAYLQYVVYGVLGLLLVVGAIFGFKSFFGDGGSQGGQQPAQVAAADSVKTLQLTEAQLKQREDSLRDEMLKQAKDTLEKKRLKDSIDAETQKKLEKHRADSLAQARKDSIAAWNKKNRCQYCGKLLTKCPYKGKKHSVVKGKSEKKDSVAMKKQF